MAERYGVQSERERPGLWRSIAELGGHVMARYRSYSLEFKRLVAQQYLSGEFTAATLARHHDMCRSLIRIWVDKYEAGEFDDESAHGGLLARYEARIPELERKVGQLLMENESLKNTRRLAVLADGVTSWVVSGPNGFRSDEAAGG